MLVVVDTWGGQGGKSFDFKVSILLFILLSKLQ